MNKEFKLAIKELVKLMSSFGMTIDDWSIEDEKTFALFGYDITVRNTHLNVLVKSSKLPWSIRDKIQTVPPMGSKELDEYCEFIEKTKFGLHFIPLPKLKVPEELIDAYSKIFVLDGIKYKVITPLGGLVDFEGTLNSVKKEDFKENFGEERLSRWKKYLETVAKKSIELDDKEVSEKAKEILDKYFK